MVKFSKYIVKLICFRRSCSHIPQPSLNANFVLNIFIISLCDFQIFEALDEIGL